MFINTTFSVPNIPTGVNKIGEAKWVDEGGCQNYCQTFILDDSDLEWYILFTHHFRVSDKLPEVHSFISLFFA